MIFQTVSNWLLNTPPVTTLQDRMHALTHYPKECEWTQRNSHRTGIGFSILSSQQDWNRLKKDDQLVNSLVGAWVTSVLCFTETVRNCIIASLFAGKKRYFISRVWHPLFTFSSNLLTALLEMDEKYCVPSNRNILCLFDVDGTLTPPREVSCLSFPIQLDRAVLATSSKSVYFAIAACAISAISAFVMIAY